MQKNYTRSYNVKTIPKFDKELKRLSKKFASIKNEYLLLINSLKIDPHQGIPLGNNCYKIRFPLLQRVKENQEVQELLLVFKFLRPRFIYLQFLINQKKKI